MPDTSWLLNLSTRLTRLFYNVPFQHNAHEIRSYLKYSLRNLAQYRTLDMFYKVELETIAHCNRRCSYCPNHTHPKQPKSMPGHVISKILSDLRAMDYSSVISPHFYGEPLLDPNLEATVEEIRSTVPRASVTLYTNGDYLDRAKFDGLVAAGVNKFFVSSHEGRPPKAFVKWYRQSEAADRAMIIFETMDTTRALNNRGGLVHVDHETRSSKCTIPRSNLVIDADGNVLLCVNDFVGQHRMGNVNEQSITEIWNSPEYRSRREEIGRGEFKLDMCRNCVSSGKAPSLQ